MDGAPQRSRRTGTTPILGSGVGAEWSAEQPSMTGIDRLFREIATYLEFVAIARGRPAGSSLGGE